MFTTKNKNGILNIVDFQNLYHNTTIRRQPMIPNQVIQECIEDISRIMRVQLSVWGMDGNVLAGDKQSIDYVKESVEYFWDCPADSQQMNGHHFFKLTDDEDCSYVITAGPVDSEAYNAGKLLIAQIRRLEEAYREKFNANHFIQSLLQDNLMAVEVYNQSKYLGIEEFAPRMVYIIETEQEQDELVLGLIDGLYGKSSRDFVVGVDERTLVLVREMREPDSQDEAHNTAKMLQDMINVEAMANVRISYGNRAENIKDISRAYKEAKMAMEVGKIFYMEKSIVAYNMLGVGRLIYQLSPELCQMFLDEVFGKEIPEFDEETLLIINKFFELNLNLSETARQLFLHRNTLAYRIDKLQKMTGLDIRSFDDAMTLKLALMVAEYQKRL